MLTVTALSNHLVTFGAAKSSFTTRDLTKQVKVPMAEGFGLGDETYGRKSMVYVYCPDETIRRRLGRFLLSKGAKVDYIGSTTVEVQVSYF